MENTLAGFVSLFSVFPVLDTTRFVNISCPCPLLNSLSAPDQGLFAKQGERMIVQNRASELYQRLSAGRQAINFVGKRAICQDGGNGEVIFWKSGKCRGGKRAVLG